MKTMRTKLTTALTISASIFLFNSTNSLATPIECPDPEVKIIDMGGFTKTRVIPGEAVKFRVVDVVEESCVLRTPYTVYWLDVVSGKKQAMVGEGCGTALGIPQDKGFSCSKDSDTNLFICETQFFGAIAFEGEMEVPQVRATATFQDCPDCEEFETCP